MSVPVLHLPRYLVEWYWPELNEELLDQAVTRLDECVAAMCAEGSPVQLLMTLAVPDDEVVFGVFVTDSEQGVARVCRQAGLPPQRISLAVDARAARHPDNVRETPDSTSRQIS